MWRYRADYVGPQLAEDLLRGEFLASEERSQRSVSKLLRVLQHAKDHVLFYRESWKQHDLTIEQFNSLKAIESYPRLTKADLIVNFDRLQSQQLLPGDRASGFSKTSGTTGQPVKVAQSVASRNMFAWLKQRELRWFGFDPTYTHLSIRPGEELAVRKDGSKWPDGELLQLPGWPYLQSIFQTGPAFGFASTNSVLDQVRILEDLAPDYLLMEPATLENLAMQSISDRAKKHLRGVQAISQTLTTDMLVDIESALQVPVNQNYGLNEVGLVASRCPEGGRYHVHEEHCYVEIVDKSGSAVKAGERGTILVTALNNSAMPLVRYDTEDSAIRTEDVCPCGRTLFSFADLEGRYRRLAHLPEGSYQRFKAVQAAVNLFARTHAGTVYKYQVCQRLGGSFQLILDCEERERSSLETLTREAFASAHSESETPSFEIIYGSSFLGLDKRKFQIFYSEYMPDLNSNDEA